MRHNQLVLSAASSFQFLIKNLSITGAKTSFLNQ